MATLKRLQKEDIEKARQKLLEAIFSELTDDRFVKKQAIKQLMSTLIAAREKGMAFEKIAKVLSDAGIELAVETLRGYFFELKTQDELAAETARHARKVSETRQALERKSLDKHTEHAAALAADHVRRAQTSSRLVNAFSTEEESVEMIPIERYATATNSKSNDKGVSTGENRSVLSEPHSGATDARRKSGNEARTATDRKPPPTKSINERSPGSAAETDNEALTLDAVEEASNTTEQRTELEEDVMLQGGKVIYASGRPFKGYLSKKQIHLLRQVGKIIAPTRGRSSKDFVAMPSKL